MPSSRDERDRPRRLRQVGIFTAIPMLLVAGPLVGFVVGRLLDARWPFAPGGLVGGLLLGFLVSVRETIRMIRSAMRDSEDTSRGA